MAIKFKPIGLVHSPFKSREEILEERLKSFSGFEDVEGEIEIFPDFEEGLKDIDGFSHLIILFFFHLVREKKIKTIPLFDDKERGIFSTRSPSRPNSLGVSIVELLDRNGRFLKVKGVDMLDNTPVLDIKPYTFRDAKLNIRIGWLEDKINSEERFSVEQKSLLLSDAAKLWLAHDGLWFLNVEKRYGIEKAIEIDSDGWKDFTVIEAKRIIERLSLPSNGGLKALKSALKFRLYAYINKQEIVEEDGKSLIFRMNSCRVQEARKRKGLHDFPCKSVGIVEYSYFAKTIDPTIETECIYCPPDSHPEDSWCAWRFYIKD
ncbi:MAG: tRNA (N6-threonylcarbamoyladenosine(37)-N6)-methyltransferase TrmO [Candidatus Aminicenantia bacterium]